MQETHLAHKEFTDEFNRWRNGWIKTNKREGNLEPETVTKARDTFFEKLNLLYGLKLEPLEQKFRENPHLAFAELIEFLEIDIPAHRTGYLKADFLRWLKNVDLSQNETQEIQQAALKMCETKNIRREFRHWCRLMIKLADAGFVSELKKLAESDDFFIRLKAKKMSEAIQRHRPDLREI